ncbi:MAG: hypothetical protein Q8P51_01640 [Ignavibacteria bacterium]|nr:hypothetical protein [Ignavibacteria bacterium]
MRRRAKGSKQFSHYLEQRDEFNILYPSDRLLSVSSMHTLSPQIVLIDPDPINGEVYQVSDRYKGNGEFRDAFVIGKRGLEKIAWAAGVQFHPRYTRRTDDGRNPRRVEFQAVGSIQKPDGSWYSICRSKEINLDVIEQELRSELETAAQSEGLTIEKEGAGQRLIYGTIECSREISLRLERQMLKRRKNMVATADSGAYSRVVRSLLNIQPTYSYEELQKPFVVPSVALDMEYLLSQTWAREHLLKGGHATTLNIFGPAPEGELRKLDEMREEEAA